MDQDVQSRLGFLPDNLTTAYDEIYLQQVNHVEAPIQAGIVERALIWVLVADYPLPSEILLSVVRIDVSRYNEHLLQSGSVQSTREAVDRIKYITPEEVSKDLLKELCANLLAFDPKTDTWAFSHASVAQYLEGHRFSKALRHGHVVFACLVLLFDIAESLLADRPLGAAECLWLTGTQGDGPRLGDKLFQVSSFESRVERNLYVNEQELVWYSNEQWRPHLRLMMAPDSISEDVGQHNIPSSTVEKISSGLTILFRGCLEEDYGKAVRGYMFSFQRSIRG